MKNRKTKLSDIYFNIAINLSFDSSFKTKTLEFECFPFDFRSWIGNWSFDRRQKDQKVLWDWHLYLGPMTIGYGKVTILKGPFIWTEYELQEYEKQNKTDKQNNNKTDKIGK